MPDPETQLPTASAADLQAVAEDLQLARIVDVLLDVERDLLDRAGTEPARVTAILSAPGVRVHLRRLAQLVVSRTDTMRTSDCRMYARAAWADLVTDVLDRQLAAETHSEKSLIRREIVRFLGSLDVFDVTSTIIDTYERALMDPTVRRRAVRRVEPIFHADELEAAVEAATTVQSSEGGPEHVRINWANAAETLGVLVFERHGEEGRS